MPEKYIYLLGCSSFIIINTIVILFYYESGEFLALTESRNRTLLSPFRRYRESNGNVGTLYKNASFVKLGQQLLPVWNDAEGHFLGWFSSRYVKIAKNPCWVEFFDMETDSKISEVLKSFVGSRQQMKCQKPLQSLNVNGKLIKMRCLPYFMIIGQPKCGTTDLFFRISQHPHVIPPLVKGPHWWTRRLFGGTSTPFSSYTTLFFAAAEQILNNIAKNSYVTQEQTITGEASPSTLWDTSRLFPECSEAQKINELNSEFQRSSPENYTACSCLNSTSWVLRIPENIKSVLPNVLFIVILRNPTNRLYSDFLYFNRTSNKSKELFHQKVETAIHMFQTCSVKYSSESCAYSEELRRKMHVRLHIGLYVVYLRNWMKVFKTNQFHVIRFEDYIATPKQVLNGVFKFLKLGDLNSNKEELIWNSNPLNRNPLFKSHGPMLNRTRQLLDEFYYAFNYELSKLLRNSKFLWQRQNSVS